MKTMDSISIKQSCVLLAAICASAGGVMAQSTNAPTAEASGPADLYGMAPGEFRNWITFVTGVNVVDGNKGAFMQRYGVRHGPFGGIEDFHWEQDVGKGGLFRIDGKGIFDNHDYSLRLELSHPDKGYLRAGFDQSRTWTESGGGYFAPQGVWIPPSSPYYALDRGSVWFEAGLRRPDMPELTFRYEHQYRRGEKDSTEWGDTTIPGPGTRGIAPSFYDINERRDIVSIDGKHTIGNTDVGLGVRFEKDYQLDSHNILRTPTTPASIRYLTEKDGFTSDMFNVHAWTETQFKEDLLFTTGYSFTTMDVDNSGSRIYGPGYDPVYDPLFGNRQTRDEGFINMSGGSQLSQHVVMLNLQWSPFDAFTVTPSLRVEREDIDNSALFQETNVGAAPGLASTQDQTLAQSQRGTIDVTECIDFRYVGVTNWVFYAQGSWMEGEGDLTEQEMSLATSVVGISRNTGFRRYTGKYEVGANWYPLKKLNFAAQYYHKTRTEDYGNVADSTANFTPSGDRYPAYILKQGFDTDDMNFRATYRPWNNVTLVSRYDFQLSTINMAAPGLAEQQSGRNTIHVLSQSVSWAPTTRVYVQANGSYYYDRSETPAAANAPGATLLPFPRNDYWSANCVLGCALSQRADAQLVYTFYKANDLVNNAAFSQPYGASGEQQGISATLTERLRKNLRMTLKYGFFRNRDITSGGYYNYDAHVVSSSLQYFF